MWSVVVFGAYRLVTALPLLRWQPAGAFIAIVGHLYDLFLLYFIGKNWNYQLLDKDFDLFYMTTFLVAAHRWKGPERGIAAGLFAYRMIGFVAFEATHWRPVLILFPNVFEFWFVAIAAVRHFMPSYQVTAPRLATMLSAATVAKLGQEYALYVGRWFDAFTIMDFLGSVWHTLAPF